MNKVIDIKTAVHYLWGSNYDSWVLADTEGLSVKQERMPGGTKEKLHFHTKAKQFFFVLKGTATFYIDTVIHSIGAQQGLLISPKEAHFIANETEKEIVFLVISQPSTVNDRMVME